MPLALYCPATARVRGGQLLYSRCPMQDFYAIVHKDEHSAFGVSFPYGDYSTTINVVVNKVWLQQMQGYGDDPDEEEDYDV